MSNRSLLILYGSETGCAQDVAETIGRQARRRHFRTRVFAMDDYNKAELVEENLVIFVCSTTGQGEEPYNMKGIRLTRTILNSSHTLSPTYRLEAASDEQQTDTLSSYSPGEFDAIVKTNDRITAPDHFQDVRHIVLCNDSGELNYNPGDIAVITPQNLREDVDAFLEQMEWTHLAEKQFQIVPADEDRKLPSRWLPNVTFRDLFIYYLDVFGVPRRSFFEMLAFFATDSNHVERLRDFTTPEGQDDMLAYCQRPRRTIAEVLFDFKPCVIPLDYILDLFPALQPRSFSIASSLRAHGNEVHLCVAIVKYKTKMRRIRRGVCTKWLATLKPGDVVKRMHIVKGTMSLPAPEVPLIAIGPGTGIAPMRAFLEERMSSYATVNILLFGCRYEMKDYHYRDEWNRYIEEGRLIVFTAFSREQNEKLYVQDRVREQSALLWNLVDTQGAKIVLSGSAGKMPEQVAYAFKEIFMKEGGLNAEQAENYFSTMVKTGQYQEECWS
ncbi:NADPH-dependent diflavin oxidoreductase 1 [Apophysomyces ossiformis]|uniref:NADPH-dependent diflavin oxidoreductase 1 n=1 Tax=Apophysomyces ossiformis TaxID=679940 RepID=A0A8H7BVX0_9FUNG|nr:NADPH-dependent diflavin oxidoreductase 1 [Apophysomyces ossiformis]